MVEEESIKGKKTLANKSKRRNDQEEDDDDIDF